MKEAGKAYGGGVPPPPPLPPGHRRPRPWWPGIAVASLLAAWLLLSGRASQPLGPPALQMRAQAAPLPAALAPLGGGSGSEGGSSSSSGTGTSTGSGSGTSTADCAYDSSSELRTEVARQLVPELQQSAARAQLFHRWSFNPAALNATGAPLARGLRIPRILHHGALLMQTCLWLRLLPARGALGPSCIFGWSMRAPRPECLLRGGAAEGHKGCTEAP